MLLHLGEGKEDSPRGHSHGFPLNLSFIAVSKRAGHQDMVLHVHFFH